MTRDYRFQTTVEPQKFKQILSLPGTEWSGLLSAAEFGEIEAKLLVDFILQGNPGRAFYLESKTGDILACCVITQHKALCKEAGVSTIGTVPDPSLFGVNNATAIRLSYVFVAKDARGSGLMGVLVPKAIEYTEAEILKKELAKSSDRKDSFKLMVQTGGRVDQTLARHYLAKKYVWYLYSAIGLAYTKYGFKAYPLEGYQISLDLARGSTGQLVERMLSPDRPTDVGKTLRLLDGKNPQDRNLIDLVLQGRQLELLTDLNRNVYHSELRGDLHSSLSLTNLSSVLSNCRPGSSSETADIMAQFKETFLGTTGKRQSSILLLACPKFAILPNLLEIDQKFAGIRKTALKVGSEENVRYADYYGAVLTNELQQKSFYILWMSLKGKEFTIVAMGEMKLDMFAAMAGPRGPRHPGPPRRKSSLTGLNEMGGFNFQDLDLLVNAAVYVARKQAVGAEGGSVHVNVNDLPTSIPKPVLHDFFLNYLPKAYDSHTEKPISSDGRLVQVLSFTDMEDLPMLRKYGCSSADFELDWVGNSLITWG
ncbi:hypothetical protein METBIDRAFT_73653 [Metschnikowia bicuspidata var. bicuspidata NRRL YB-4993]|uniref:Uncharacterized protein n=1 Tax=Metschnikowia bicuspidata var. bicuspidata NRRL YB-4993 TaxID=869754 RepID=A0A1A0H6D7_9ASCO|nr:hypothetical protein METBIDRAFT_73653 [Metschnikowia bicuspidata var. bicuspidata NRRL YB-4993]OBA19525.1 hypothetical protein METBIDRAFT_73653 [Metschnikowia bicuspidata var. bicuspidata NRRL YB-4993]